VACRGVFFAITEEQQAQLLAVEDDESLMAMIETIEEAWDADHLAECDKSWDAMHRALTDGRLDNGNGEYPFSHCVLGPRQLHQGDDYIVSLVEPGEVRDVALALEGVTEEWFLDRYRTVVPKDYALEYGDTDMRYTWDWFEGVRELYRKAAAEQMAVLFTVDQ
jgi:Domain of unknown function (DUF1877)